MGLDALMAEECPDELFQFGFTERTSALAPAALVVGNLRWKAIILMLLDLVKAYDLVPCDQLMDIIDKEHTPATCGMVPMILQSSEVRT